MADKIQVVVPDLGGAEQVDVIEILVKPGDKVNVEDSLVTLEGDKASMEVPSSSAGVVDAIAVKVGDKISEGDLVVTLLAEGEKVAEIKENSAPVEESTKVNSQQASSSKQPLVVPDMGDASDVDVVEINVKVGDQVAVEDSLVTLEGDKATMEVPASLSGVITEISVKVGDKISAGDIIGYIEAEGVVIAEPAQEAAASASESSKSAVPVQQPVVVDGKVHASPAVRRIARELNISLANVKGTGAKGRITKDDIKKLLSSGSTGGGGLSVLSMPTIDFSQFGEIDTQPLSKIKKISGANLHRNWVSIPHVTQFDEADITELEAFRKQNKESAAKQGIKLTPIVFIMKAVVAALREFPHFNASLGTDGDSLVLKRYFHIGVAVDTPNGLVVPVIRDVDKKSCFDLAKELGEISGRAREKGLGLKDMQGGCFTISSLGGIGGTAFTPIINAPEVAILGVSKSSRKPVYDNDGQLGPRLMLPLSLSYDHRVIDGADGARFMVYLASRLADIRTLLL